jgi:1-deoxy-D-xylulose-5-phosphate synthase
MTLMAPKDEAELKRLMLTALKTDGPCAIRYPRGVGVGAEISSKTEPVPLGEGEILLEGGDVLIIALGSRVYPALEAAAELEKENISATVFNARFVKPLPEKQLLELIPEYTHVVLAEENVLQGGFSSAVLEFVSDSGVLNGHKIKRVGIGDFFIEHGKQKELRQRYGLNSQGIKEAVLEVLGRGK